MDIEWVRRYCLSLAGATEQVQWGSDLLFKVGGKMFAAVPLEPAPVFLSCKCSVEEFADMVERQGVIPAPYLARASWIAIEKEDALPRAEVLRLVSQSYELVRAKLPRRLRAQIVDGGGKSKAANPKPSKTKLKSTPKRKRKK